jgi:hypothetical protein
MTLVYVVYDFANIADDWKLEEAMILGIYTNAEKALQMGQRMANLFLFKNWLQLEPEYISKCHSMGYSSICFNKCIGMVECKLNAIANVKLHDQSLFTANLDEEEIRNHPRFQEYEREYDLFMKQQNTGG